MTAFQADQPTDPHVIHSPATSQVLSAPAPLSLFHFATVLFTLYLFGDICLAIGYTLLRIEKPCYFIGFI